VAEPNDRTPSNIVLGGSFIDLGTGTQGRTRSTVWPQIKREISRRRLPRWLLRQKLKRKEYQNNDCEKYLAHNRHSMASAA
jgi:hypothetical protein